MPGETPLREHSQTIKDFSQSLPRGLVARHPQNRGGHCVQIRGIEVLGRPRAGLHERAPIARRGRGHARRHPRASTHGNPKPLVQ